MDDELETSIKTADGVTVSVSDYDDGAWLNIMTRHGSAYTPLTREEAEKLISGLQAILAKGA